jgi:hypothetical protein
MIALKSILWAGLGLIFWGIPVARAEDSSNVSLIMGFIDPRVKISDILTIVLIFISALTILLTLQKEKNLRQKEQADRVRTAVAKTIANIKSWRDINFSLFAELEGILDLSISGAVDPVAFTANLDKNLKKLHKDKCESSPKISIPKYESIYEYDPWVGLFFSKILERLRDESGVMFEAGLKSGSLDVLYGYLMENSADVHKISDIELRTLLSKRIKDIKYIYKSYIDYLALEAIVQPLQYLFISQDFSEQTRDSIVAAGMNNKILKAKELKDILFIKKDNIDADNPRNDHRIRSFIIDPTFRTFNSRI